jgi:Carboxypeptidase regulatory-like domain
LRKYLKGRGRYALLLLVGVGMFAILGATCQPVTKISGTVTSVGGTPVPNMPVPLRTADGTVTGAPVITDANGHYTHNLPPGNYKVEFGFGVNDAASACGEFFNDKPDLASADVINVASGTTVTANAQIKCSAISGTVTGPTGAPLANAFVSVFTGPPGSLGVVSRTDAGGHYTQHQKLPGDYRISFQSEQPLDAGGCSEWYNDKTDQASADVVSTNGADIVADASLPCG